ncbi:MAG: hypothetical protein J0L82_08130 [Deltaproteobacteria bacterium]|nr:hypothetical protein [Deltaproteobacteria bacterium]
METVKRVIGIDFTDGIVGRLRQRGFTLAEVLPDIHGFRAYFVGLEDPSQDFGGFEIQIVTDEVEYLRYQKRDHFFPFVKELPILPVNTDSNVVHVNTCFKFESVITSLQGLSRDLAIYLGLKKNFQISCVVLRCRDFEEFCRSAAPDKYFDYAGEKAALIHLGPSCFDLLVLPPQ